LGFLDQVLQRRLESRGCDRHAYLLDLERRPSDDEIGALARELTVGETYFFRNREQFRALSEVVVPERMRAQQTSRTLRFLSAGCASGEEAYSLAIIARETCVDPLWQSDIRAVDLNPLALEKAKRARYTSWALRDTTPELVANWFRPIG